MDEPSVQDRLNPNGMCFGCGSANEQGLQLKSFVVDDTSLEATWAPQPHHLAFPGILNGGIIGTLLDCHSTITSWWSFLQRFPDEPPYALTADYTIRLLKPTPIDAPVHLTARVVDLSDRRATVEGSLTVDGEETATSTGLFIRPKKPFPLK
ncbi:MAG: PaaI family thioesterase [Actinobacteria bacterium]|nr:PaaI family thioesterase [Actinomycetota bacterium]